MAGVHDGHRERIRQRIEKEGVDSFQQHELLEYLLYYAAARGDMNPVAHALIDRFGSLDEVLQADPQQLRTVPGVGAQMAEWIGRLREMMESYVRLESGDRPPLGTLREVRNFIVKFPRVQTEEVWQLCLGANCRLLVASRIADNAAWGEVGVLRDALSEVMSVYAYRVVLLQFTGTRRPEPEEYDIEHSHEYARTLAAVGVHLLDHVLVDRRGKNVSMVRQGRMEQFERPSRDVRLLMERYLEEE